MEDKEQEIINNEQWHRFELHVKGGTGIVQYTKEGNTYLLMHTEVPEELEGQGVAGRMVQKAFEYIEKHGAKMTPYCPYIFTFLKRHPEWERIQVAPEE